MKLKIFLLLMIPLFVVNLKTQACTVAVVSGKYTKDGRPLLWKNRDTWAVQNKIMYFDDGKYEYMGLVNSKDISGKSVWIGSNSQGFAIMNSASYNLNFGDTNALSGLEGKLIKKALATCATIEDFEKLMDNFKRPTGLEANFGVIDGKGGAAMYEVNNKGYVKFDANDSKVAPFGYVIRANYSFTGRYGTESSGYIRYNTANELFYNAVSTNSFDAQFIIQDVTRSLKHSLVKTNLYEQYENIEENKPTFAFFHDFIPRRSSASSCVVQGVKKGENPELTTLWSIVGFPLTSIVVPTWLKAKNNLPEIVKYDENLKNSPVCYAALELKKEAFPIRWGKYASKYYININALVNSDKTGITQKISPYENKVIEETNASLEQWRKTGIKTNEVISLYKKIDQQIREMYLKEFDIKI